MSLEGLASPLATKRVLKQPRLFRCTLEEAAFDSVNSGKQGDGREEIEHAILMVLGSNSKSIQSWRFRNMELAAVALDLIPISGHSMVVI